MLIKGPDQLDALDFREPDGLLPVVAQHAHTGVALMLAYANRRALERTLAMGEMWYYSRSRSALWHKGETSGNVQRLISLHADCDADAVLARTIPAGPACHTGADACFGEAAAPTIAALAAIIRRRAEAAMESSYTSRLLNDRNLRLKKLGEEAAELVVACAEDNADHAAAEAADVLYHVLVACTAAGTPLDRVLKVLEQRLPTRSATPNGAV